MLLQKGYSMSTSAQHIHNDFHYIEAIGAMLSTLILRPLGVRRQSEGF